MGYMREKRQFARVNDQTSELIDVQFRVEQGSMLELALSTLYANDLNDNHDCTAFHINMQTTRLSWSTAPLPIWALPLAPWKPLKSGQAIPTYCLMQNRPKKWLYAQKKCQAESAKLEDPLSQISANVVR